MGEKSSDFQIIEYRKGVHIKDTILWLDSQDSPELTFISCAGLFPFLHQKRKILCTSRTARLIKKKIGFINALEVPFGNAFNLGPLRIELLPSGFIPGSAQLFAEFQNKKILYTGSFSFHNKLSEKPVFRKCDILILPVFKKFSITDFPTPENNPELIKRTIEDLIDKNFTPVILASSPGSAQEFISFLTNSNYSIRVHQSIWRMNKIYREIGISLKSTKIFKDVNLTKGEIVIFPEKLHFSTSLNKIENRKFIFLGDSFEEKKDDEIFIPFSASPSLKELFEVIKICKPFLIYTTGPYCIKFSKILNNAGYKALPLSEKEQLRLF